MVCLVYTTSIMEVDVQRRSKKYDLYLRIISFILLFTIFGSDHIQFASAESSYTLDTLEGSIYLPSIFVDYLPQMSSIFGVDITPIDDSAGLAEMRSAGAYILRRGPFKWKDVEPIAPIDGVHTYIWDSPAVQSFEEELLNAQSNDMTAVMIVGSAPEWAREDQVNDYTCAPIDQADLDDFAVFMVEIVKRYSMPPYNVKYFELYNEPDIDPSVLPSIYPLDNGFGCWGDTDDPYYGGGYYAEMLKVVYPKIKTADPNAQVLVGGLLLDCDPVNPPENKDCTPSKFLEGILLALQADGGDFFDGISFHAYDYYNYDGLGKFSNINWHSSWNTTGPVNIAKTRYIVDLLSKYGYSQSEKLLLNTESAIICSELYPCDDTAYPDFELTKAYYLVQAYAVAIAEGLDANIWYSAKGWRDSGLLNPDLSHHNAYDAYLTSRKMLANAEFIQELHLYSRVAEYEFVRANGRKMWVLWSRDGLLHQINLPGTPSFIMDALGVPVQVSTSITLDLKPIFIEWAN